MEQVPVLSEPFEQINHEKLNVLTLSIAMSVAVFGSTISPLSSMSGGVLRE